MAPNAQFQRLQNRVAAAFLQRFQNTNLCSPGIGAAPQQAETMYFKTVEMPGFSHLYIRMHCLLLFQKWFILIDFVFKGEYPMKNRLDASRTICNKNILKTMQ